MHGLFWLHLNIACHLPPTADAEKDEQSEFDCIHEASVAQVPCEVIINELVELPTMNRCALYTYAHVVSNSKRNIKLACDKIPPLDMD